MAIKSPENLSSAASSLKQQAEIHRGGRGEDYCRQALIACTMVKKHE